ncbi:MAG TPA: histidine kinase [Candidatus Limnocylindrales bacterium]|nr:histidine kinase [Candidatus Limnocylindrales bacterium]
MTVRADGRATGGDGWGTAAAVLVTLLGIAITIAFRIAPQDSVFFRSMPVWLDAVGVAAAGCVTVAAWAARAIRPRSVIGLAVLSAALVLPIGGAWSGAPNALRAAALAPLPLAIAAACHVAVGWGHERHGRGLLAVTYGLTGGALVLLLVGYDPFRDPSCDRTCLSAPALVEGWLRTPTVLATTRVLTVCAAIASIIGLTRLGNAAGVPRTLIVAAIIAEVFLVPGVIGVPGGLLPGNAFAAAYVEALLQALAAVAVGTSVLVHARGLARARAATNALVARLADPLGSLGPDAAPVAAHYAVPGEDRWVDGAGRTQDAVPPARSIVITDPAGPVARVIGPAVDADDLRDAFGPAARLGLHNAQLAAATAAHMADLRASQRRIVTTADSERKRIERDLHDGAQQRLVSAAFHLRLARNRLIAHDDRLSAVEVEVARTLERLRTLGNGIFPRALAEEGIGPALEDLERSTELPLFVETEGLDGVGHDASMAAYATVTTVVDRARDAVTDPSIRVRAARDGPELVVHISATHVPPLDDATMTELADRAGASGGSMTVTSGEGKFELELRVPCAS